MNKAEVASETLVLYIDGRESTFIVPHRIAKIAHWLARNADVITQPHAVNVTFDCAGKSVRASWKITEPIE